VIEVDRRGQLGNQMFQYAFAVAAAERLNTAFRYDTRELGLYFVLQGKPRRPHLPLFRAREYFSDDRDDPAEILETLTNHTRYGGYFYGYGYSAPAANSVRKHFTVKPEITTVFSERYGDLLEEAYVCAHVRLTDFATYREDVRMAPDYYRRALERVGASLPVVFVSDDIATVRATLDDLSARFGLTKRSSISCSCAVPEL
jgi:hypothetical protein